jgi:hypothetical protein
MRPSMAWIALAAFVLGIAFGAELALALTDGC